jgi:hypothetical protein
MYVSEKYQIQWWFPLHVGSTVTRFLLEDLGFTPYWGQHPIDPSCDYDIIVNVRNPYSLALSIWRHHTPFQEYSFEDYVNDYGGEYVKYSNYDEIDYVKHLYNREHKLKKIVKVENLYDNLTSIDFIHENKKVISSKLRDIQEKKGIRRGEKIKSLSIEKYYTQNLANIIYENRKKFFDFGGYDRDSWKTLIY